jgi:LemA protein
MGPTVIALIVLAGLVLILAVFMISIYNRLVGLGVGYKNAFAQIDVQLRRRYDLIPNLVEVAKGYMAHERGTLEAVIAARNQAAAGLKAAAAKPGDAAALSTLSGNEGALAGALGRLFAVAEAYPDLKANQNMMQLTEELTSTENKISFARQAYNDAVMRFNGYRRSFPPVVLAPLFGYAQDAATLELGDRAAISEAPKVKF